MAKEASPRKVSLDISYKGNKLDEKIQERITSFSYTDVASGSSDSVSITLENIDKKWMNAWYPEKGSTIAGKLSVKNWEKSGKKRTFNCGTFVIDDISFSGRPLTATIKAVSVPASTGFKVTKKSKTWEDVTIEQIASKIAAAAGIKLYYSAGTIRINEVEQSNETDSSFLYSLCEKYGLAMKVYNQKLVIFSEEEYEKKNRIITIDEKDMESWSFNTTMDGTYTGVKLSYTKPSTNKTTSVTVGTSERLYDYKAQVDGQYDAELQAKAKLRSENKKAKTMEIKIMANTDIIASGIIQVTGLGKLNGLYYADQVKHNIGTGYTMNVSMHWFADSREALTTTGNAGTYIVKKGDTLTKISVMFYKTSVYWRTVYEANKQVIESTAIKRGLKSSDNGHWIFPGTVLTIPSRE